MHTQKYTLERKTERGACARVYLAKFISYGEQTLWSSEYTVDNKAVFILFSERQR